MSLRLFNTLSGKKELFQPLHPPRVTIYVCGVTVYDDCHIGHARGAVVFDVLRRFLEASGHQVTYVRNITDLDDKIIERARGLTPDSGELRDAAQRGQTPLDLKGRTRAVAEHFTERFQADFTRLGLQPPQEEPRATEFIPQMIAFIGELVRRGMAYRGSDGVYFSVRAFSAVHPYGPLSHRKLDEMLEGARGETGEGKRDPLDFALWKNAKPEEPQWTSPWGAGRPGWHIECSTMATSLLGDAFDIHGGGMDLLFPHHENELAQAVGAGKPFARVWLHNGLLTVAGQKMAKSAGNVITIPQALERHPADVLRLFFLGAHYRSPMDFTRDRLGESARALETLDDFLVQVEQRVGKVQEEESGEIRESRARFTAALEDDLNTSEALSALFMLAQQARGWFADASAKGRLVGAARALRELAGILGLRLGRAEIPAEIQELAGKRDLARRERRFEEADRYRREIQEQGFILEDTSGGTVIRPRR